MEIYTEKRELFFFSYNHLFKNMNWFSIPHFGVKVVPFIYDIGEKGFFKYFVLNGMKIILLVNPDPKGKFP